MQLMIQTMNTLDFSSACFEKQKQMDKTNIIVSSECSYSFLFLNRSMRSNVLYSNLVLYLWSQYP